MVLTWHSVLSNSPGNCSCSQLGTSADLAGVEMEAMVAASVASLTVYDMCKAVDKGITIEHVRLERKTGGKSGDYFREDHAGK